MERIPISPKTDQDLTKILHGVMDGAQGNFIKLDAVPTGDVLKAGQIGYFGNDVYLVTLEKTKIKLSGASWS